MINHTLQAETSHSRNLSVTARHLGMGESEIFRRNLLKMRTDAGISAAELSRKAGLNARAVKDIEEGRAVSPKLATVFALAQALGADPGEMIGLGPRCQLTKELAAFLSQYDEADQSRLLAALEALKL